MPFENDTLSHLSRVEAQQSFRSMHEQYEMDSVHTGNNEHVQNESTIVTAKQDQK